MIIEERFKEACESLNIKEDEKIKDLFIGGISLGLDCVYDVVTRTDVENYMNKYIKEKYASSRTK